MNKIIYILFLLFLPSLIYSQPIEQVYSTPVQMWSIEVSKNIMTVSSKEIMIRGYGLLGSPYVCCSGCPYNFNNHKFNKIIKNVYIPYNEFLKPYICTDNIMEQCNFSPIDFYAISKFDSNLILRCFLVNFSGYCQGLNFKRIDLTTNGGTSFTTKFSGFTSFGGLDISQKNDNIMFVITGDSLFKSTNRGTNWFFMRTFSSASFVKFNPYNPAVAYVSTSGGLMLTTNGGANFTNVLSQTLKNISFVDSLTMFGYTNISVFKSTNIGLSWSSLYTGSSWNVNCLEVDPSNNSIVYAGSTNGLWRSANGGVNFSKYINVFPTTANVLNVLKDPGTGDTVYAVTPKGIFRVWGMLVDVQNYSAIVPDKFEITNVYPNPFNPTTKIHFNIPLLSGEKERVISLKIYDITGKEMQTLVNEILAPGSYEIMFDGNNLSSGVYFFRITAGDFVSTKKMLMIK
jgi:hypothetical protein